MVGVGGSFALGPEEKGGWCSTARRKTAERRAIVACHGRATSRRVAAGRFVLCTMVRTPARSTQYALSGTRVEGPLRGSVNTARSGAPDEVS